MLGLPWYVTNNPTVMEDGELKWVFQWDLREHGAPNVPLELRQLEYWKGCGISFEMYAKRLEDELANLGLICQCCALAEGSKCPSCLHAIAFHRCTKKAKTYWKKGSLFGGVIDFQVRSVFGSTCCPSDCDTSCNIAGVNI